MADNYPYLIHAVTYTLKLPKTGAAFLAQSRFLLCLQGNIKPVDIFANLLQIADHQKVLQHM